MAASEPVVLIVEDEQDVAETYRLWLADSHEVRTARDGEEGIDQLDEDVDVVLLDRMMPGVSGDQVLAHIREQGLDCRVAMVTAVDPDFDILEMGFDAYLSKPVKGEQLEQTVQNLLERATYDSLRQEYYALVEKRATLEASKNPAELEGNPEYEQLCAEIDERREELSETIGEVDTDDDSFVARVRDLGEEM
jgi:two-component system response regulator AdeR